ncbi:MAG: DNA repair protein RecN [bacterium]|nr:DNA repair protein RecN [bacterium]
MLEELRIRNFAIIDQLDLTFADGLNVITGETGAGKSIIIDAVELLLGGKADPSFVRAGADKAVIEGTFALHDTAAAAIVPILRAAELVDGETEAGADADVINTVTISRELRSNGRSVTRVNGVAINLDVLERIGEHLVDVHGQSAHLSLLKPASHIELLDRFANAYDQREAIAEMVDTLHGVRRDIHKLLEDEAALKRRADRLRGDVDDIDEAALNVGEDEELKAERNRLANSEQLARLTGEAVALFYGDERGQDSVGAVDQIMNAVGLIGKLAGIDSALKDDHTLALEVSAQVDELAKSLRRYADTVEYNPTRLDAVEERLETITALKRRYGGTIPAVLDYADKARAELEAIENSEERLAELRADEEQLLREIGSAAARLSQARREAAAALGDGVVQELADLRMGKAQFQVGISQQPDPNGAYVGKERVKFDATGIDQVEFMMSANPGEPLRPLAKVASGGESARIMLALKRVLSAADHTPTLIFDEIDQGIGGRVGTVVGEKLWGLTRDHQVMVVTHLAQLAGYADRHYRVMKLVEEGRTRTQIIPLTQDFQRIEELAAMLGTMNESGYQSAKELIDAALAFKRAAINHG